MRFKVGDYVKVVNLHGNSRGGFHNGDIIRICQVGNYGGYALYGAISPYDSCVWYFYEYEIESLESITSYKVNRLCDAIIEYIESVSNYGAEEDWLVSELKGIKEYDK